ncbi:MULTISPECIES: NAD(P)H-flavin reductase [Photobacterium]|uniref:FMN reductase n=1 Tax=Photobacterium ganghwense TaxID=320778 RepID=A0A0J1H1Y9_9GAMM|nr:MULTISPECIES: NAD(P)H-flavin reductase [Photobacterium]KLV05776.1 FMN reductase [Photobacterium ganghwense]MBV1839226.1 NAD(P)H-flavin reductase [Photobacterium ganghwense]PSU06314.1 NAD(P)H-flavin reductase [Photobacterium ganghwense]QSV14161.1 NAD(P)H-flavin reductase [Photobacterium ganghwense]
MSIKCEVKSVESLACYTYRILLRPAQPVAFKAGQYLLAVMGEKDKRPFSIANSPCRENELELHIGAAEHNPYALEVVEHMKAALASGDSIEIEAPHGEAWLREDSEKPLLLIAGGTGFSYVRSILERLLSRGTKQPIFLYWGGRDECQLYADAELQALAGQHANLTYVPVVETAPAGWSGKVGNVLEAVSTDFVSLAAYDIYICGRFEMAGAARELFTAERGAERERMFADAYSFI